MNKHRVYFYWEVACFLGIMLVALATESKAPIVILTVLAVSSTWAGAHTGWLLEKSTKIAFDALDLLDAALDGHVRHKELEDLLHTTTDFLNDEAPKIKH